MGVWAAPSQYTAAAGILTGGECDAAHRDGAGTGCKLQPLKDVALVQRHLALELRCTVGASIWGSPSARLLTEKGKPRVTVGRKANGSTSRIGRRWPGCRRQCR